MIKLELQFVSGDGGFSADPLTYNQIKRTDKVALYERSRRGHVLDYEYFFIRMEAKGKVTKFPNGVIKVAADDKELYPASGQWGKTAWSNNNRTVALRRFDELVKEADSLTEDSDSVTTIEFHIPNGEFTTQDFATLNKIQYSVAFLYIKTSLSMNKIKFVKEERRNIRGKPTKLYTKIQ